MIGPSLRSRRVCARLAVVLAWAYYNLVMEMYHLSACYEKSADWIPGLLQAGQQNRSLVTASEDNVRYYPFDPRKEREAD